MAAPSLSPRARLPRAVARKRRGRRAAPVAHGRARRELRYPGARGLPSSRRPGRGSDRPRRPRPRGGGARRARGAGAGEPGPVVARHRRRAAAGCCSPLTAISTGPSARSRRRFAEHERLPMPFERARTLLVFGLLSGEENERRRAHESLEQAHAIFEDSARRSGLRGRERELRPSAGGRRAADADPGRAARRRTGGERADQPRGCRRALHQPEDRRVEPRACLPQARRSAPAPSSARTSPRRLIPPGTA